MTWPASKLLRQTAFVESGYSQPTVSENDTEEDDLTHHQQKYAEM